MIKKVGVIGAGQMGNGIAHVARLPATMSCSTTTPTALKAGLATIHGNLARQVVARNHHRGARKRRWSAFVDRHR